jgi:hypothetical protein
VRTTTSMTTAALLAVTALAGCTGASADNTTGVASLAGGAVAVVADESAETALSDDEALLAFAQCMRDEGLDFADPTVNDDGSLRFAPPGGGDGAAGGIDRDAFQTARALCGSLIEGIEGVGRGRGRGGGGGQGEFDSEAFLLFAECMRATGVEAFPDPGTDGRPDREAMQAVDFNSAEVQAAAESCAEETGTELGGGGGGRGAPPAGNAPSAGGDA